MFAGGIGPAALQPPDPRDRGHSNHPAPICLHHRAHGFANGYKSAIKVGGHDPAPQVHFGFLQCPTFGNTRIGHTNLNGAARSHSFGNRVALCAFIRDIHCQCIKPITSDILQNPNPASRDCYQSPLGGQSARNCQTYSSTAPGHQSMRTI